ncbi:hypothetical protein, partial [Clavibacter phaseoli]|uniref:hypothetical protein n=1 Tax=Clavibacter phaseoli TaxID=1734031 RepID=UPI000ECC6834
MSDSDIDPLSTVQGAPGVTQDMPGEGDSDASVGGTVPDGESIQHGVDGEGADHGDRLAPGGEAEELAREGR